jgi:MobA/VirD2-like, nuclease domain
MTRRVVDLRRSGRPLLDIRSYGRAASARRTLSSSQRQQIALTVRRAPEVMVKVSGGARSLGGVETHLSYIGREEQRERALGVETDDGQRLSSQGFARAIVFDWDLDLDARRAHEARWVRGHRRPFKLVHNIIFSMPPGTSPGKLLKAVRKFATDQFALKHRYAFALHTDEAHPHVHLVVKAVSEQGERLNIRKETLRNWRQQFATHLRELGVAANATERAVRGQDRKHKQDAIHRAARRNESTHERKEALALVKRSETVLRRHRNGRGKLEQTRWDVIAGWHAVAQVFQEEHNYAVADEVRLFATRMVPPRTDQEHLVEQFRNQSPTRERGPLERTR